MSHKLRANKVALRPKDIICEMRVQWGFECLYGKAWQAKEYAERLVFGPSEESFQLLPSYFYMLEQENPSTVTTVATNEEERFKYYFWSYGACIWGFRDVMRPTIVIDATHLKGKLKVKPINRVEFEVKDGKMDKLVNLSQKTCSCCEFQTDLLPCSHAIAAISKCKREAIKFYADYYKTTILVEGYSGYVHPVGHPSEWDIPNHVKQIVVLPPPW
ncbi:zinc finger protein [Theobroma cacao]|nr:zinc finger protein [Theobroma cacao]